MRRLLFILTLLLAPVAAFGQARIDQLGAAATPTDATVVPVCEGCGAAVNAVGATGTQLTSYFATKFFSIANNLSEVSNKSTSRVNLGIPAGTTTTLLHGNAAGDPTMAGVATGDILANVVTYAKMQQSAAGSKLLCVSGGVAGNWGECTLSARLTFSGSLLDIANTSISATYLTSTAASDNLGAPLGDLCGPSYAGGPTVCKVNAVAYPVKPGGKDYVPITTAADGSVATYKLVPGCTYVGYTAGSTNSFACNTQPNLSLTAANPCMTISTSPTTITSGNVTIGTSFPIQTTAKTVNYSFVDSHSGGASDACTTVLFNGTNLVATLDSSSASYFPANYALQIQNFNATNLTVNRGTGSSVFNGVPGLGATSFTLAQGQWAFIQADSAGSPNNYLVQTGGSGGSGSGAVTKINAGSASNQATFDITGLTNSYYKVSIVCNGVIPLTTTSALNIRFGTGATVWQTSNYQWRYNAYTTNPSNTTASVSNDFDVQMVVTPATIDIQQASTHFTIELYQPAAASAQSTIVVDGVFNQDTFDTDAHMFHAVGNYYGGNTVTGVRMYMSAGNITIANCTWYGWQK